MDFQFCFRKVYIPEYVEMVKWWEMLALYSF